MKDYYFILGISHKAGSREIKQAFRKLCQRYHPDKTSHTPQSRERYIEICEAYRVLSRKERKAAYDRKLAGASESHSIKEEFSRFKDAIYPEIKTSYRGHYPWFAAFALIIVAALAVIFSFNAPNKNIVNTRAQKAKISPAPAVQKTPVAQVQQTIIQDSAKLVVETPKKDSVLKPGSDSVNKLEHQLAAMLERNTPALINKVTAGKTGRSVIPYNERNYRYFFQDRKLYVTYTSDLAGKISKNTVVIPTKDIETIYYYNDKIWISSKRKSIWVNERDKRKKYNTEFFSVKFNTANASEEELSEAFKQLNSLYNM
jgi:curved DNA-binding protein CbpA